MDGDIFAVKRSYGGLQLRSQIGVQCTSKRCDEANVYKSLFDADNESENILPAAQIINGIGIVEVDGFMAKDIHPFFGANTKLISSTLSSLARNKSVKSILLKVDSPGGDARGTFELNNLIKQVDEIKPVFSFIEDTGASAAFWVASAARGVFANAMAEVGSIGTFTVLVDDSEMFEKLGVKFITISSGEFKGLGADGKVTKELTTLTM